MIATPPTFVASASAFSSFVLTGLSIRNVVLIESLDLDMGRGLTALTGETGAGKSIILDSLGMATGARSDRGLLRSGADKAQAVASFALRADSPVRKTLESADIDLADGEDLTLRRSLSKDGRSKAFINDQPVSVKLLSEIGSQLLEVHGQHDGRGLLDPTTHIHLLDQFGGHAPKLAKVARTHAEERRLHARVAELEARQNKADSDRDFLDHAIAELDRLDPKEGEDEQLADERRFLQGAEGALQELEAAQTALGEDGAFEQRLNTALAGIERVRAKFGESNQRAEAALGGAAEALERALIETQEARAAVSGAAETFDVEPGRLDLIEERLFALRAAARKYGTDVAGLATVRIGFANELSDITTVESDLASARAAQAAAAKAYTAAAAALTRARQASAKKLARHVMAELPPLKMERARFEVDITGGPATTYGTDRVRFHVSTNPGTPMGPLDKIASGGEMARFALAIKVALAGRTDAVMIFDEVDQGVGGAVASAVGRRLAKLADSAQVMVVTHSPQVAAAADHQFRISKSSDATTTRTTVVPIDANEREEEIARMLAGETVTQEARAAARQLMGVQ